MYYLAENLDIYLFILIYSFTILKEIKTQFKDGGVIYGRWAPYDLKLAVL